MDPDDLRNGADRFDRCGDRIANGAMSPHLSERTRLERYKELFGVTPLKAYLVWTYAVLENGYGNDPHQFEKKHLLWALMFMKTYDRTNNLAARVGCDPKTFRKWVWKMIGVLSDLSGDVVSSGSADEFLCHWPSSHNFSIAV